MVNGSTLEGKEKLSVENQDFEKEKDRQERFRKVWLCLKAHGHLIWSILYMMSILPLFFVK